MDKLSFKALAICFVAGGLLVLAFAPFNFYILAFISLAILFYLWAKGAPKTNFYLGLSFGLGLYCLVSHGCMYRYQLMGGCHYGWAPLPSWGLLLYFHYLSLYLVIW